MAQEFLLREEITHFGHVRTPERIVSARGPTAHGHFECLRDCSAWTSAGFLAKPGKRTPLFARFSSVAAGAGSEDTPRHVRGFAVKFYTEQGNFDLLGNNIPVLFGQDAMQPSDLLHAATMEADGGYPQAGLAHDSFWDRVSSMPESLHRVMWAMSDRTLPRSLRMMDGFGVHTFRLINAAGDSQFVKFHWRSTLGVQSTTWDEAVQLAGADNDYHRRDLYQAIARGDHPSWALGLQVFDQATADQLPFDALDATKLIPEELVPVQVVGRMVLDRNPDNFFAETEPVAFCPSHLVPGINFGHDPLLQSRRFSGRDTRLAPSSGPNIHPLPINARHKPTRDGRMQMQVATGRVAYAPSALAPDGRVESPTRGLASLATAEKIPETPLRAASSADHYSQARQFFRSMTATEQGHMVMALAFELGKVGSTAVRLRVLGHLAVIDAALLQRVADKLGQPLDQVLPAQTAVAPRRLPPSPALSQVASRAGDLRGRSVAVLVAAGVDDTLLHGLRLAISRAGATTTVVAPQLAGVRDAAGQPLTADAALATSPSCLFDAVVVLGSEPGIAALASSPAATNWLRDAWRHLKVIGHDAAGKTLLQAAAVGNDAAVLPLDSKASVDRWVDMAAGGKYFAREGAPGTEC